MPIYCYKTVNDLVVERLFDIGKAPPVILVNGVRAERCIAAELVSVPSRTGWPLTCCASGVNAEDADKLRDHLAERGIPTEVTDDGDPVYTSHTHRKKALKARGFIDKAGYN